MALGFDLVGYLQEISLPWALRSLKSRILENAEKWSILRSGDIEQFLVAMMVLSIYYDIVIECANHNRNEFSKFRLSD
jgi:hypothetical protein